MRKPAQKQLDKFRDLARAVEADEDEGKFNAALRSIATKTEPPEGEPSPRDEKRRPQR